MVLSILIYVIFRQCVGNTDEDRSITHETAKAFSAVWLVPLLA